MSKSVTAAVLTEIKNHLDTKEWGDARSFLDAHINSPNDEVESLLSLYKPDVEFSWSENDGWYYTEVE
jgi:hypothetical protein